MTENNIADNDTSNNCLHRFCGELVSCEQVHYETCKIFYFNVEVNVIFRKLWKRQLNGRTYLMLSFHCHQQLCCRQPNEYLKGLTFSQYFYLRSIRPSSEAASGQAFVVVHWSTCKNTAPVSPHPCRWDTDVSSFNLKHHQQKTTNFVFTIHTQTHIFNINHLLHIILFCARVGYKEIIARFNCCLDLNQSFWNKPLIKQSSVSPQIYCIRYTITNWIFNKKTDHSLQHIFDHRSNKMNLPNLVLLMETTNLKWDKMAS